MKIDWVKREDDGWCHLERVNLDHVATNGVYLIWHGGENPRVIKVGQGDIALRICKLRKDPSILAYNPYGELYVTWAQVPASKRDGVVSYLTETWLPLLNKPNSMVFPITVNSPFEES